MLSLTIVDIDKLREEVAAFERADEGRVIFAHLLISFPTSTQNPCL
jgi:hypothetical protein